MKLLRAGWRLSRAIAHGIAGLFTIVWRFPKLDAPARERCVQDWARGLLQVLGIEVEVQGEPAPHGPVLLVANHISWLDILVIHASRFCRFVSKSDVKHWPLIGTLATGAGTLYIERASARDAVRVVHHIAERLRAGDVVAVFPEGTTSDGLTLLPFHANLLQAAISADVPAQPVGLSFIDSATRATSLTPIYIGDDTLAASVWRTLTGPPITAVVRYGDLQKADGRDRREWAAALREAVGQLRGDPPR